MLDVHGHNPPSAREQRSLGLSGTSLNDWIRQRVKVPHVQVKSKLRGNNLYLLFEGTPCPDRAAILPTLTEALSVTALTTLLPPQSPPVYRVIAYGRLSQQSQPEWTESLVPHDRPLAQESTAPPPLSEAAGATPQECNIDATAGLPLLTAARQGQPEAIARHLSDAFSTLGVAVRVKLEKPQKLPQTTSPSPTPHTPHPTPPSPRRLLIACESAYSPDPLLFAEPIAQRLRALELRGFQDAVVFGQVAGETRPEWVLRVDLTPPTDILKAWARWGDVQAITRLLNRVLLPEKVQTVALLKEATLHLTCRGIQSSTPDKLLTIATIVPLLEGLSPQGIRAATIYGFAHQDGKADLLNAATTPALFGYTGSICLPTPNYHLPSTSLSRAI